MMVAAHPADLAAAQRCGMKVAYVPRPLETGPAARWSRWGDTVFDVQAPGMDDLATALGLD